MNHPDRVFGARAIESEDDLVEVLTNHKWPLCMAFEFANLLYLNDGDREDSPEYAALRIDRVDGLMVEGLEVGRIRALGEDAGPVRRFIRDVSRGRFSMEKEIKIKVEPDWHHGCPLCQFEED